MVKALPFAFGFALVLTTATAGAQTVGVGETEDQPIVASACNATDIAEMQSWVNDLTDEELQAEAQILLSQAEDLRADNENDRCALVLGDLKELRDEAQMEGAIEQ